MINTIEEDLSYYHKNAEPEEMKKAIIIALKVLHRVGADTPGAYHGRTDMGNRAFKHADRYLQGNPLRLPQSVHEEEIVDQTNQQLQHSHKRTREKLDKISQPNPQSGTKQAGEFFTKLKELLA